MCVDVSFLLACYDSDYRRKKQMLRIVAVRWRRETEEEDHLTTSHDCVTCRKEYHTSPTSYVYAVRLRVHLKQCVISKTNIISTWNPRPATRLVQAYPQWPSDVK